MVLSKSLILSKNPVGYPVPGQDLTISSKEISLDTLPEGAALLLKTHYLSYDPYMRGRMRPAGSNYIGGFPLGSPVTNNSISTVILSSSSRFKKGDLVIGYAEFSEYQHVPQSRAEKNQREGGFDILNNEWGLDPMVFLGALGMPGLTAYSALYEIGKPKKGDVFFVSAASGAVGQIVGQLAKREGMKVIGSVGSKEKLDWIKGELGFDAGFDYKTEGEVEGLQRCLAELGKDGLDVYFDNVGGEMLDVSLRFMNTFGRIIACGQISQSSRKPEEQYGIKNMGLVIGKRILIRGFIVSDQDFGPKYIEEHWKNVGRWIKDGEIVVKMDVTHGIEEAADGLVGMLKGKNFGKAILKLSDL